MKSDGVRMLKAKPWLTLSLVCVAGGLGVFTATASTRAGQASCGPPAAHTVAADSSARIYRVVIGHAFVGPLYAYYGCSVAQRKPELLSSANPLTRVRMVELRGAIAGLIVDRHGVDTGGSTLTVRDLADGRLLHTVGVSYMVPRVFDSLVTYVLAPSGNIAWTTDRSTGLRSAGNVTIRRAVGHTVRTLDQGTSIRASSLRLRGHTVQWIDGGRRRYARLP